MHDHLHSTDYWTEQQRLADNFLADESAQEWTEMTPEQKSFYDLGFATAIKQRMDRDRAETEQLFRQCVRIPEQTGPLMRSK